MGILLEAPVKKFIYIMNNGIALGCQADQSQGALREKHVKGAQFSYGLILGPLIAASVGSPQKFYFVHMCLIMGKIGVVRASTKATSPEIRTCK